VGAGSMPELIGLFLSYGISLVVGLGLAVLEVKLLKYTRPAVRIKTLLRWACWSLLAVEPLVIFLITLPYEYNADFYRVMEIAAPISNILIMINFCTILTFPFCPQNNIYLGIFIRIFQLISMIWIWFLIFGAQFSS
jgi:hypothetical protein